MRLHWCPACNSMDYEEPRGCNSCGYVHHEPLQAGVEPQDFADPDSPLGPYCEYGDDDD